MTSVQVSQIHEFLMASHSLNIHICHLNLTLLHIQEVHKPIKYDH